MNFRCSINMLRHASMRVHIPKYPETFEHVVFPPGGAQKLPPLPAEPVYTAELGEEKYKVNERMIEARGVEEVNNMLIHKQYGLAAVSGGMLRHQDLQMIMTHINKSLVKSQFAIWRVDAPWLPRTRKAQGTRLGGGKGSIHHYVTPVRSGRIICEVGGYISKLEMAVGDDELLRIPFRFIVYIVAGLPFSALSLCVFISLLLHWDESTRTHCGVANWLPSISAAVASYAPERYIWRIFISLHTTPRLGLAIASKNFLLSSPLGPTRSVTWFPLACHFACFLNLAEVICLLLLTSISSVDDYALHKLSFIGFAVCGITHMFLNIWLYDYSGRRRTSPLGERSFQYKIFCCGVSTGSLFLALYFFYRHNTYCETGVYTMFALCEYAVVVFNILFHSTLYFDFHSRYFSLMTSASNFSYEVLPMHYNYEEKRT